MVPIPTHNLEDNKYFYTTIIFIDIFFLRELDNAKKNSIALIFSRYPRTKHFSHTIHRPEKA